MQVLYPLSLFAVFCAISSADTQESIDAEPTVQISKEAIAAVVQKPVIDSAHRHSMNQLEPDLAKTIFDVGKNPLQRTTTLPSQQLVDSRSTSELKRGLVSFLFAENLCKTSFLNCSQNLKDGIRKHLFIDKLITHNFLRQNL